MFKPYKRYLMFDVLFLIIFFSLSIETGHIIYFVFTGFSTGLAWHDYMKLKEIQNGTWYVYAFLS